MMLKFLGLFCLPAPVRTILKIVRRIFPYCDHPNQGVNRKPCFYYHLNLCPGICVGKISRRSYSWQIKRIVLFLRGDHQKLLRQLALEMKRKSKMFDFESASITRDQIRAIENLNSVNAFSEFSKSVIPGSDRGICYIDSGSMAGMTKSGRLKGTILAICRENGLPLQWWCLLTDCRQRRSTVNSGLKVSHHRMIPDAVGDFGKKIYAPGMAVSDLIMIDGGEPQLRGIIKYFEKLPVKLPKMIGLVKGEETIILPEKNSFKRINLPKSDPFLKILMALRDEAHRFARRYHHKLHLKSLISK